MWWCTCSTPRSGHITIWKGSGPTLRASRWSEDPARLGGQGQGTHRGAGAGVRGADPPLRRAGRPRVARARAPARSGIAAREGSRRALGARRGRKPAHLAAAGAAAGVAARFVPTGHARHRRRRGPRAARPRPGEARLEPLPADAAAPAGARSRPGAVVPGLRDPARRAVSQVMEADPCAMPGRCVEARPMPTLVLVRHGQSLWNLENRFTGWVDVPLTLKGMAEARRAGELLKPFRFDVAYTSVLSRAQETLRLMLEVMAAELPVIRDQ